MKCKLCDETFTNPGSLGSHRKAKHPAAVRAAAAKKKARNTPPQEESPADGELAMIGLLITTINDAAIDTAVVARALIYVGERFDVSLYVATPAEA